MPDSRDTIPNPTAADAVPQPAPAEPGRTAEPRSEPIVAPPPPDWPPEPEPKPPLPRKLEDNRTIPGPIPYVSRPRHLWLTWGPIALFALWLAGSFDIVSVRGLWLMAAFALLMGLNALRFFPRKDCAALRRWPVLILLGLPWLGSILLGPLGWIATSDDPGRQGGLLMVQYGCLAASALLPFLLLPLMRGGRLFTLTIGVLGLMVTLLLSAVAIQIIAPGS